MYFYYMSGDSTARIWTIGEGPCSSNSQKRPLDVVVLKHYKVGVTGLSLKSFKYNWGSDYQTTNNAGIPDPNGEINWHFNALVGLFFPAVTGIMVGSNRSSSFKDTQRSIPIETLAATLTTTTMYFIYVFLLGSVATREKLFTDRLLTATIAWPSSAIIYIVMYGDSTARICTIGNGPCSSNSEKGPIDVAVLKHYRGRTNDKSKNVTTLDWNVG